MQKNLQLANLENYLKKKIKEETVLSLLADKKSFRNYPLVIQKIFIEPIILKAIENENEVISKYFKMKVTDFLYDINDEIFKLFVIKGIAEEGQIPQERYGDVVVIDEQFDFAEKKRKFNYPIVCLYPEQCFVSKSVKIKSKIY